jgi:hypothetical protein
MRKLLVFVFAICFSLQSNCQMLNVSRVQNVISLAIQQKLVGSGFTPNDPRYGVTLDNASSVLTSLASSAVGVAVAGFVTGPAWLTLGIALGVGAVVNYALNMAVGGIDQWNLSSDPHAPKPITPNQAVAGPYQGGGLVQGGSYWSATSFYAADSMSPIYAVFARDFPATYGAPDYSFFIGTCTVESSTSYNCLVMRKTVSTGYITNYSNIRSTFSPSGAPSNCASGTFYNASTSSCNPVVVPVVQVVPLTAQQAISSLSAAELEKPLNPKLIAVIADLAWRSAAMAPGYAGLPYQASNPITEAEVDGLRLANTAAWPTLRDFVVPQTTSASPWILPHSLTPVSTVDTSSPPTTINPASANPLQNLGADPAIGAPALEATPTAQTILAPLLNLFPDFRAFVVPAHQATCPKPSFNVFGSVYVMQAHCDIAESNRAALFAVMAAVWLLSAAIIVLKA